MNIVFMLPSLGGGGAERVVSVLSNEFVKREHNVSIIIFSRNIIKYDFNESIKIYYINSNYKIYILRYLNKILKIRKKVKSLNPDVLISFLSETNMVAIISSIIRKYKIIISERSDPNQLPSKKSLRIVRNFLYNFSDGYVFQTNDMLNYFNSSIRRKSVVIPNPIRDDLPSPYRGERKKIVVTAARLVEAKNIHLLIKSFSIFHKKFNDYKLRIYGQGPLKSELEKLIVELNMNDNIEIRNFTSNIHNEINDCAIYVVSSNYEGISNSMIEAMGLGIPIISTDHPIGGARMFIDNGVNGFLVPLNDAKEMASQMEILAHNEEYSKIISKNEIKIRDILSAEKIVSEWEKYINEVIYEDFKYKNKYL